MANRKKNSNIVRCLAFSMPLAGGASEEKLRELGREGCAKAVLNIYRPTENSF